VSVLQILDLGLAILVLAVAAWTIAARQIFGAVVGYVAYGLLLSIVWIRLYAPDVALTEAAIGSGVTGVLLVTSGARLRATGGAEAGETPSPFLRALAAVLSVLTAAALAAVVLLLPEPPPTLAPEAERGLAATGLGNPVTAVLIAYRSFDTMLEKVVLVLAVVGVWSLAPDRFWGGAPASLGRARPDNALVFLDQALVPLGILVGIHIFWVGADEPGGAFQAGAILAAMWMIVMIARLAEPPRVAAHWLRLTLIAGPAIFLIVGLSGMGMAGSFFAYPAGFAKPIILFIEAFMLLSIAVSLPMLVAGPPRRSPDI
jgi:multisubunit Na+/H+ antiporter MnhB subunit